ncbi:MULTISPECIES: RecB family exonuclease [unclassified Saccharopolyspora]|uniref:RecB family exonuclease n=1 Tax=unclassified Saccharopolyspora TaxID=2646250 RepID=UPI001CD26381|nr:MULTISPECIES: RecB family exonuclease [unclassified Saccharopolyspora]MCA1190107.1 RecB family exonuclease [Saccharopolyspora sp. 6T]MCA1228266.1 RecB family exonuclease [Saccharopolyspora sp. 6M]MCA1282315.1 RecB family exonuclease [Saccharopolyspora sp. 7B]
MVEPARTSDSTRSELAGAGGSDGASLPSGRRRPALSPSRAGDFKQCPLLYRFRAVDRLPETPTRAQVRGTVVHSVLERMFALPAEQRDAEHARDLLEPAWQDLLAGQPELAELFDGPEDPQLRTWLGSATRLLDSYFELEDPRRLEPEACELRVETELDSGLLLRGFIDRVDVAPTGEIRLVDYKTGAAPRQIGEAKAMFQMKFYALVLWRTRGEVPKQLLLMYLSDGQSLAYAPDEAELRRFERTLEAIWQAILRAGKTGDFRPNPSKLCDYCDHKSRCPEFGGTPPPYPGWPEPDPGQESVLDRTD